MPYPQQGDHSASTIFINSQRPPPGSHLSAWLHGDSTVVRNHLNRKCKPTGMRKATHARGVTAPVQQPQGSFDSYNAPPKRPRPSTLSVLDPVQSSHPAVTRTVSTDFYEPPRSRYNSTHPANAGAAIPPFATGALQDPMPKKDIRRKHHHRHRRYTTAACEKQQQQKAQPTCFPSISDRRIRQKSIGTLISGTLLMLVLTICKYHFGFSNLSPIARNRYLILVLLVLRSTNTASATPTSYRFRQSQPIRNGYPTCLYEVSSFPLSRIPLSQTLKHRSNKSPPQLHPFNPQSTSLSQTHLKQTLPVNYQNNKLTNRITQTLRSPSPPQFPPPPSMPSSSSSSSSSP